MKIHGEAIHRMVETGRAYDLKDNVVPVGGIIRDESAASLQRVIIENKLRDCLEVGMAMGMSTLAILYALELNGGGHHTAIDPFQTAAPPQGFAGVGLAMVERARLSANFEFLEEPSYLALPKMVAEGRLFDFIFIDGYHTFDYTFVDYFYADLLLRDGGILVFDDVMLPMVHKVCWFLETHKAYERLGPKMAHPLNPAYRLKRKLGPQGTRGGDKVWGGIQVYRKVKTTMVRPLFFHTPFYPYFRTWWALKRLRSLVTGGKAPVQKKSPY